MLLIAVSSIGASAQKEYRYSTSEARLLDFTPKVSPQDLTVSVKVIGKRIHRFISLSPEELNKRVVNNNYNQTLDNLRAYAVFVTSGVYDCDLIVGARFNIEVTSDNGAVIEMFGYPANFVNWGGSAAELPTLPEKVPNYGSSEYYRSQVK